jgi:flagellar basal body-associated protein FliL
METSSIIILIISSAISFALGRVFVHFRNKKRKEKAQAREAQALRNRPLEAESRNRSKRKRQLQRLDKEGRSPKK